MKNPGNPGRCGDCSGFPGSEAKGSDMSTELVKDNTYSSDPVADEKITAAYWALVYAGCQDETAWYWYQTALLWAERWA